VLPKENHVINQGPPERAWFESRRVNTSNLCFQPPLLVGSDTIFAVPHLFHELRPKSDFVVQKNDGSFISGIQANQIAAAINHAGRAARQT
jgi:hypothetical protein